MFHSWRILFRRRSRASMRAPLSRKGRPTLRCLHIHSAVSTMVRKTLWSDVLVLPHTNLCSLLPRQNKWMALPELCRYKRQDPSTCCPGSLNALLFWRSSSSPSEEDELDEPSSESLDAASLWGSTSLPLAGSRRQLHWHHDQRHFVQERPCRLTRIGLLPPRPVHRWLRC